MWSAVAARRRVRAGQPAARRGARPRRWSRRRTCRPRGASSTRSICASRRSPSSPTSDSAAGSARLRVEVQAARDASDAIDRDAAWTAKRAALGERVPGRAVGGPRAGLRRLPRSGRAAASTTSPPGARWPRSTATTGISWPEELQHPARPGGRRRSPPSTPTTVDFHRWLQWQLDEQLAAAQSHGRPGRHGAGHHARPGRRRATRTAPTRGRCRTCSRSASPPARRRTSSTSSARTGRSRRGGPTGSPSTGTRRSATWSTRCCGTPAACASTTSSGCSGCGGFPKGAPPTEGTYVRYDHEAMIGILALEAHRAGAVVVGEDLGTVEPWVRDYLRERGLLGTSILWFEFDRDGDGGPLRRRAVAGVLPVLGHHPRPAADRRLPGRRPRAAARRARPADPAGRRGTGRRPGRAGGLAGRAAPGRAARRRTTPTSSEIVLALYRYLGRTPSRLLALALTDAVGDRRTQNQPGTTDEYPNWRVPLTGPDGRQTAARGRVHRPAGGRACRRDASGSCTRRCNAAPRVTGFTFVTRCDMFAPHRH